MTIKAAVKQQSIKTLSNEKTDSLKYYRIKYACIHGGRLYNNRSTGKRKSSTFLKSCAFHINVSLSSDRNFLEIVSMNETHNHDVDAETHQMYPKNRKLSTEELIYAQDMMALDVNKKKLQHQLANETGKSIILKDLSNIAVAAKRSNTRNDLSACLDNLRRQHGCTVDVLRDENDNFCGLFAQDQKMRDTLASFPEILFLDAT